MNWCDVVLTPSANSEAILLLLGVTAACIPVQVWDYLHPQDYQIPHPNVQAMGVAPAQAFADVARQMVAHGCTDIVANGALRGVEVEVNPGRGRPADRRRSWPHADCSTNGVQERGCPSCSSRSGLAGRVRGLACAVGCFPVSLAGGPQ